MRHSLQIHQRQQRREAAGELALGAPYLPSVDQRAPVQYSSQAQGRTPEEGVKPAVGFSALMRTSMAEPRLSKLYCFRSGGVSPGTCAARDAAWKLGTRSIVKLNVTCDVDHVGKEASCAINGAEPAVMLKQQQRSPAFKAKENTCSRSIHCTRSWRETYSVIPCSTCSRVFTCGAAVSPNWMHD